MGCESSKGLPFHLGYRDQWNALVRDHPEVAVRSTCRYQNWEVVDPERWVPDGYVCVRVDSRGAAPFALAAQQRECLRRLEQCIMAGTSTG
jgi:hypothetical protein